jgi:hypothetical protein
MVRLVLASLVVGGVAFADPMSSQKPRGDVLELHQAAARNFDMNDAFGQMLSSAGLGIASGKIVLMKHDKEVAAVVGKQRTQVGPAFDLSLSSASALMRVIFQ